MFMLKSICKRCMAVERVALFQDLEQGGNPVPWRDRDESLWESGKIECPHRRKEINIGSLESVMKCLRRAEQIAARKGKMVVFDEMAVESGASPQNVL